MSTRSRAGTARLSERRAASQSWPLPARIGALGVAAFLASSLVAGALSHGYHPLPESISALAAVDAQHPVIMITGFVLAAIGLTATGVGIANRHWRSVSGLVAALLIMLAGPAMAVAGFARQDCSDRLPSCLDFGKADQATTHYWVHQYVSLGLFVVMTIAMFVLARALWRSAGWRHLTGYSLLAGVFCLATIALLLVDPPALDPYFGLLNRVFIAVMFGWPVLAAGLPARARRSLNPIPKQGQGSVASLTGTVRDPRLSVWAQMAFDGAGQFRTRCSATR